MLKKEVNQERMITATHETLSKHESEFADHDGLVRSYETLGDRIGELKAASKIQKLVTKGLAGLRLAKEKVLVAETMDLCASMTAYGEENDDPRFVAPSKLTPSKLHKKRKPELAATCLALHELANTVGADLDEYGYGSYKLGEYLLLVEDYRASVDAYRVAVAERIAARERIADLIVKITRLFTSRIDKQMNKYQTSAPGFYIAYFAARKIVNLGVRHKKPADDVTDVTTVDE